MKERIRVILKSGKDQSIHRYHPWIFSGAIKKMSGEPAEGDEVEVFDNKDNFLAVGYYQPSSIAIRIMDFSNRALDSNFYSEKLSDAIEFRRESGFFKDEATNVFRLVHAEGDGLPGLIIDYYNGVAVTQIHSVGIYKNRMMIARILSDYLAGDLTAIYDKSKTSLPFKSGIEPEEGYLLGESGLKVISENGYKFHVDWVNGQKTGFYIDQRENRKFLGEFTKNRDVLNMFGYTGGFSVYAMRNAKSVHTVDASFKAVEMANRNIELNYGEDTRHLGIATDAFEYMAEIKNKYDLIILDPPAFAKHNNVLHNALQGYKRLNLKAIEQIRKGGIIFTFSCSQVVSKENFRKSVFAAAANTGRRVKILYQLSQPVDHPVNIYHPESEYLKGLVLYVD